MTIQLCEDKERALTDQVWDKWIDQGTEPRKMNWLEVKNLAGFFLKVCTQYNKDSREYDFYNLLDYTLNFNENRAEIENQVGYDITSKEKEVVAKFKDYLTEEQLKDYTLKEKDIIQSIENTNKTLTKKVGQITKKLEAQETQTFDNDALKKELEEMSRVQTLIYARLEQLSDLPQKVAALKASQNFKDLGKAIEPILKTIPEPTPQPAKPKNHFTISGWLKTKHIPLLDLFAAIVVTIMFTGISYGIVNWLSLTWECVVGLSVLWLTYVVVVRLVAGGILN